VPGGFDAAHPWHLQVHQDDIWLQLVRLQDGLRAGARLSHHRNIRGRGHQRAQPGAKRWSSASKTLIGSSIIRSSFDLLRQAHPQAGALAWPGGDLTGAS